jgi:hypothetical protein
LVSGLRAEGDKIPHGIGVLAVSRWVSFLTTLLVSK